MKKLIIMAALIIAATTTIASAQGIECPSGQFAHVTASGCACFYPGETSTPPCLGRSSIWDDVSAGIVGLR